VKATNTSISQLKAQVFKKFLHYFDDRMDENEEICMLIAAYLDPVTFPSMALDDRLTVRSQLVEFEQNGDLLLPYLYYSRAI
ncbi:unnamed protein product, partial [Didymodactylos carnosus]